MEQYLSAAKVAKWVGVHYRTIENWASQGKLERENGKYGLLSAMQYKIEQLNNQIDKFKNNPDTELNRQELIARVDKERAIARIKNLEADQKEGKLVDADEVMQQWQNLIASCKAKFLALPSKLALELSGMNQPEAIKIRLSEVIDEALLELSN